MDSPAAADMRPVEEEMRLAAETPEEAAEYLSAAAMRAEAALRPEAAMQAEALRPAAATLGEALLVAPAVERPADSHRPRRTQRPAHWPRRIVNKRHCSSRVSLQLRMRIQITDWAARDTNGTMDWTQPKQRVRRF